MENEMFYVLLAIFVSLLILNGIATFVILNTYFKIKERRIYQILFVWLLPYIGGIFAIYINLEDYFHEKRLNKVGNNSNISDSDAVNMGSSVGHHGGR